MVGFTLYHCFGSICVHFYSICRLSFNVFVDQVLQLTVTACHNMNIVCERQIADRSNADTDGIVIVVDVLPHNSVRKQIEER